MASPVSLRLDKETRLRIARIARRRRVTTSQVIRDAIDALVGQEQAGVSPYEAMADLIGVVRGGNPRLSSDMGRRLTLLLERRRVR
jgi:hypothetical protein